MNQIVIVSSQAQYLAEIITADAAPDGIIADVLPDANLLFTRLSKSACTLLIIDLDLLNSLSQPEPFFAQLKRVSPQTPVLILGTLAQRAEAVNQLKQGAADYLLFPIEPEELLFKIKREILRAEQPGSNLGREAGNDLLPLNNVPGPASLLKLADLASVGRMVGSVAHQINNPLTITMNNSQLLMYDYFVPETKGYELAQSIFNAGKRISGSMENWLEFSNQDEYYFMERDLVETIEGAVTLVHRPMLKARINVTREFKIKPAIFASAGHLKLLWVNLLLNARDAVDGFAANPKIIIATRPESDNAVKVKITDNGVGLSKAHLSQIFDPFFTTKLPGQALGLGLYSAQAIVERHKGQIQAYSEPGVGTTFEVILPLYHAR